jgi:hypothetical protein
MFLTSTHQKNKMITPDQLTEVNDLQTLRTGYLELLEGFDTEVVTSFVTIKGQNTGKMSYISREAMFKFGDKIAELEAELTEVVKANLVAEIAEIDLKIAVYIGEEPIMSKLAKILSQPEGEDWKLRAEEAALRNQNLKELAEDRIIRTGSAQDALKQSNLRWVQLENGNWTRRPEDEVADTPKEEAITKPEKKLKSVTGKWDRLEASGPTLPVFFTQAIAVDPPIFVTVDDSKPKLPEDE